MLLRSFITTALAVENVVSLEKRSSQSITAVGRSTDCGKNTERYDSVIIHPKSQNPINEPRPKRWFVAASSTTSFDHCSTYDNFFMISTMGEIRQSSD
eukprot:2169381-Rhodomonas_salina.3